MAVKTDVVLLADAGDVTVARRTAFYTYGKFEVILPEGREQQETDNRIEDGYIARAHDGNVGRFDFGFIRADATVNIDAGTSDLEAQIDSAELRAEGDVFFEGDITPSGFNGFIPGVDYGTGDIVTVRRWGTSLALPVTSIELEVSESAGTRASRVHVSGQLIHDAASRRRSNDDLRQQIAAEKRERLRQVGAVDSKATQAKDTADSAKTTADEAKQATADNRTYIDEQLETAGAAVEQGRQYLLQMEEHVTAGNAAASQAQDLASQAAAAAAEAVQILNQLNPLRDDVTAAHAEVTRLHDEASQFTAQAAEHVRQASQHAADAVASASSASQHAADGKRYAEQALAHEAEGRRQAGLAANSASAALQNANRAQQIVDDANGLLSQVQGYSQDAKNALAGAKSLLANAGGQGKSLGDVLLEVAQKHQETLTAHQDILDLHSEVLEKHGEAIRYVAVAAAQASSAAMHAAQAAQEALGVATNAAKAAESASLAADDAAKAASSAGKAANEAAKAAENNRQAIGKLQEADGKLQEADQKLQQQINILEDSQELLADAVKILSAAVAQAAAAAQYAIQAADNAGNAAGKALEASAHNSSAIDAMQDTLTARSETIEAFNQTQAEIDAMQNDAIVALEEQAAGIVELQNRMMNMAMVDSAGSTHPDVTLMGYVGSTAYDAVLNNITPGTKIHADFYNRASNGALTYVKSEQYVSVSTSRAVTAASNNQVVNLMWARPSAQQIPISLSSNGMSLSRVTWTDVPGLSRQAGGRVTSGQLTIRGTWNAANRGSTYGIRVLVGTTVFKSFTTTTLGPLSFLSDGESRYTVSVANLKLNANQTLKVQVYSTAGNASQRSLKSVTAIGSWIEHAS